MTTELTAVRADSSVPPPVSLTEGIEGASPTQLNKLFPLFWKERNAVFKTNGAERAQMLGFVSKAAFTIVLVYVHKAGWLIDEGRGKWRWNLEKIPAKWREALEVPASEGAEQAPNEPAAPAAPIDADVPPQPPAPTPEPAPPLPEEAASPTADAADDETPADIAAASAEPPPAPPTADAEESAPSDDTLADKPAPSPPIFGGGVYPDFDRPGSAVAILRPTPHPPRAAPRPAPLPEPPAPVEVVAPSVTPPLTPAPPELRERVDAVERSVADIHRHLDALTKVIAEAIYREFLANLPPESREDVLRMLTERIRRS